MIFSFAVWSVLTPRGRTQIDVGSPSGTRFLSIPNRISPGHRRERVGSPDGSPRFGREDAAPARTIATDLAMAANCSPFAAPENRDLNPPSGLSQAFHHSITGSSPARVATGRWVLIASLQAPVPALLLSSFALYAICSPKSREKVGPVVAAPLSPQPRVANIQGSRI